MLVLCVSVLVQVCRFACMCVSYVCVLVHVGARACLFFYFVRVCSGECVCASTFNITPLDIGRAALTLVSFTRTLVQVGEHLSLPLPDSAIVRSIQIEHSGWNGGGTKTNAFISLDHQV